jgi:hypothetical protein
VVVGAKARGDLPYLSKSQAPQERVQLAPSQLLRGLALPYLLQAYLPQVLSVQLLLALMRMSL